MINHIKSFIIFLILVALIPSLLIGQNYGSDYKLMLSRSNEEQLLDLRSEANRKIFSSSCRITGGLAVTALGVTATYIGYGMLIAEPVVDLENPISWLFFPVTFGVVGMQYAFGLTLSGLGVILGFAGIEATITHTGSVAYQLHKKHQINLELKRFKPTSYKDSHGMGVGISIPLNHH